MSPSVSLMPHAVCWAAAPRLVWTMVVTNFITFLSYVCICLTLLFLARRTRRVIARDWAWFVVGFALFILACGSTHLLEVITTWVPIFWVDAATNIVTAVLSALVAIMLIRRAAIIGFSVNDYADRLANTEEEKRRMEQSLLAARKLEDVSRVSAVISHEIGNPLEAINNLLYLIRNTEGIPPEVMEMASMGAEEATRVLTISRSTLSFFRQSAEPETVDLASATASVRFLLDSVVRERQISLDIAHTGDVSVHAFAGETRQVLLNLIRNACEASTRMGSRVAVTLTGNLANVQIIVEDHGTGIPPTVMETLFQFGKSTKGEQGNGLGLWTVQHLVEKHHGTIKVDSTVGKGTRFTILWPRDFQASASTALAASAA